mmetsp:Transcript_111269/g.314058  ORF Transcript_111269/g.314058 Transcript_111269/m.314058 type:complete len:258 (+) Transcript_111269:171-944(+)
MWSCVAPIAPELLVKPLDGIAPRGNVVSVVGHRIPLGGTWRSTITSAVAFILPRKVGLQRCNVTGLERQISSGAVNVVVFDERLGHALLEPLEDVGKTVVRREVEARLGLIVQYSQVRIFLHKQPADTFSWSEKDRRLAQVVALVYVGSEIDKLAADLDVALERGEVKHADSLVVRYVQRSSRSKQNRGELHIVCVHGRHERLPGTIPCIRVRVELQHLRNRVIPPFHVRGRDVVSMHQRLANLVQVLRLEEIGVEI